METTCKLEGGGGQKFGKFANVIYERLLMGTDNVFQSLKSDSNIVALAVGLIDL